MVCDAFKRIMMVWWHGKLSALLNLCEGHDDVIKWKHFPRHWPFVRGIHRSPVNSLHKGQWRGALMFSLICVWINGWVNNRGAGDLRRHIAHYEVIVMESTGHWWKVSLIKTRNVELWCFLNHLFLYWISCWTNCRAAVNLRDHNAHARPLLCSLNLSIYLWKNFHWVSVYGVFNWSKFTWIIGEKCLYKIMIIYHQARMTSFCVRFWFWLALSIQGNWTFTKTFRVGMFLTLSYCGAMLLSFDVHGVLLT